MSADMSETWWPSWLLLASLCLPELILAGEGYTGKLSLCSCVSFWAEVIQMIMQLQSITSLGQLCSHWCSSISLWKCKASLSSAPRKILHICRMMMDLVGGTLSLLWWLCIFCPNKKEKTTSRSKVFIYKHTFSLQNYFTKYQSSFCKDIIWVWQVGWRAVQGFKLQCEDPEQYWEVECLPRPFLLPA